ncbi:hypothetical protein BS47DRAFT_1369165 [Hydnum rufescens UP504]|uniref:Uncharacterized protein n=1 Tax=Hydnum rufescens UP504 TaxID=1448309 RepID=A0A9P6ADX9_9AGAM|nr:hypothetical protein BS47DRAFT_1369165 [Hydnum rufescens UP504]
MHPKDPRKDEANLENESDTAAKTHIHHIGCEGAHWTSHCLRDPHWRIGVKSPRENELVRADVTLRVTSASRSKSFLLGPNFGVIRLAARRSLLTGLEELELTAQHLKVSDTQGELRDPLGYNLDDGPLRGIGTILNGTGLLFLRATGDGKSALIYGPLMMEPGIVAIMASPIELLESDQVRNMEGKGVTAVEINQSTLRAAAPAAPS